MSRHVLFHMCDVIKSFPTQRGAEGFLFGVTLQMLFETPAVSKSSPTLGAAKSFLSRVDQHVRIEVGECFAAPGAAVGFFSRVDAQVLFQIPAVCERFTAELAAEWFLPRVSPPVVY